MKRYLIRLASLLLALCLASGSALAAEPSNAAITLNGVRTAFFGADGAYLSPVEQDGLVYVPAEALGESLGMTVETDAQTLAVTVNGVRAAFFGADGAYLPPILVDGVVYVPLVAFAQSTGVEIASTDGGYALTAEAEPTAAPTPVPTPAATPVPQVGYVPLTKSNFDDYFTLSTSYSHTSDNYNTRSFTVTHRLVCQAKTSYGLENVSINTTNYGWVTIPASGYAVAEYSKTIYRYEYGSDKAYILGIADAKTRAILSRGVTILSVSGKLRMTWQEADRINSGYYRTAMNYYENGNYESAINWFTTLASVDYKDSADMLKKARQAKSDAEKAAAEAARKAAEEKLAQANALVDQGDYDGAIILLKEMKNYEPTQALLADVQQKKHQRLYDEAMILAAGENPAEALLLLSELAAADFSDAALQAQMLRYRLAEESLAAGDYQVAADYFASAGDYKDAADRVQEPHYAQAEDLQAQGLYVKAAETFESISDYKDAATRAKEARYAYAESLLAAGQYQEASGAFGQLGDYRDAAERVPEPYYAQGEALLAAGDPEGAVEAFLRAGDYSDAPARVTQTRLSVVDDLIAKGDAWAAVNCSARLTDAEARLEGLQRSFLAVGQSALDAGDVAAAADYFALAGEKADATVLAGLYRDVAALCLENGDTTAALMYYSLAGDDEAEALRQPLAYEQAKAAIKSKQYTEAFRLLRTIPGYKDADKLLKGNQVKKGGTELMVDRLKACASRDYTFTFGTWKDEPLQWYVLAHEGDCLRLISLRQLTVLEKFGPNKKSTHWGNSKIRAWLNKDFMNTAFTKEERSALVKMKVEYGVNNKTHTTTDTVTVFSMDEVNRYFPDGSSRWESGIKTTLRNVRSDKSRIDTVIWYPESDYWSNSNPENAQFLLPVIKVDLTNQKVDWAALLTRAGEPVYAEDLMAAGEYDYAQKTILLEETATAALMGKECRYQKAVQALFNGDVYSARHRLSVGDRGYRRTDDLLAHLDSDD